MLALSFLAFSVAKSPYARGWKAGFVRGYCYEIMYCVKPIPPEAPYPEIGRDTYKDGYEDGFLAGLAEQD